MPNPFAIAAGGLSLIQGIQGAASARAQGRLTMQSIDEQMGSLYEQQDKLREAYEGQRGHVTDMYGNRVNLLTERVGRSLFEQGIEADLRLGKSGLAYSGSSERITKLERGRVTGQYKSEQLSMYDRMRSDIMSLNLKETQEVGGIDLQLTSLKGERRLAQEQAGQRFLGVL